MIIQIIPETEQEKLTTDIIEHRGVREFMVFGNKVDNNDLLVDFHEWSGGYRYLVGSLHYFANVVDEERRSRAEFANRTGNVVAAPELKNVIDMPINDVDLQEKLDQAVEKIDDEDQDKK
jgi:hypothetical protein